MKRGHCKMANGGCQAPAAVQSGSVGGPSADCGTKPVARCWRCWEDVCRGAHCSAIVKDPKTGRRVRLCADCQDDVLQKGCQ